MHVVGNSNISEIARVRLSAIRQVGLYVINTECDVTGNSWRLISKSHVMLEMFIKKLADETHINIQGNKFAGYKHLV